MSSLFLHFPPFRLDPSNERLWDETQEIPLRRKTFAVLRYLVEHPEQLVTKDELMSAVWPDTVVGDDALTGCIRDLRKLLGDEAKTLRYIETVHRRGYRFLPPVTTQPVQSVKFQVPSREEGASSQQSVVSGQQEENQQAKGENGLESRGQSLKSEPHTSSPPPIQTLDARHQTPDASAPRRSVFNKRFIWLGSVLLVAGTLGALWYLFLPLPSTQHLTPST